MVFDLSRQRFFFEDPGVYHIKVVDERMKPALESNVVTIAVDAPSASERAILKEYATPEVGAFLQGVEADIDTVRRVGSMAERFARTPYGESLRASVLSQLRRHSSDSVLEESDSSLLRRLEGTDANPE